LISDVAFEPYRVLIKQALFNEHFNHYRAFLFGKYLFTLINKQTSDNP